MAGSARTLDLPRAACQRSSAVTVLPTWMRRALLTTAAMNVLGAGLFLPSAGALREIAGVPPGEHAVYLLTIAMFVLLFGIGYLYLGLVGRADPLFIAISAAGKLSFVAILVFSWLSGAVSIRAPLMAVGDLVFGLLFLTWLLGDARRA
jgi:hypothetical protein